MTGGGLASPAALRHGPGVLRWTSLLLLLALGPGARAAPPLPDLGGRLVVIAVEDDYPPFNFVAPATGKPAGWDYDLFRALAARLHFRTEFREISWDSMIQGVASGQFDVAANGITVTPERARVVAFSAPYAQVRQRLLVRAAERRFTSLGEFAATADAKLGAQKGNTNYTRAAELVGPARIVAYDGFGDLVQALLSGDLDAVIIDDVGGQGYIGAHAGQLKLLPGALAAQDLALVFPLGSSLRAPIEAGLRALKEDGTLAKLDGHWFSPQFKP
jgi:polar amino acid transport system substrate-binding protein